MTVSVPNNFSNREFPMTDRNFSLIKSIAYKKTGINLSDHKKNMIYGRLARRLRRLELKNFDEYCSMLEKENSPEMLEFVNSITTNLTSFFRESHHFDFLKSTVIPQLIKKNAKSKKIRLWSAGCSTGEEPHSLAMVLASFSQLDRWDVKILATDLDTNVVNTGKEGVYAAERAENIPGEYRKYFKIDKTGENVRLKDLVREKIVFKPLNLLNHWPMKGPFDVIFCRNVVIYFDAKTQRTLFDRYADLMVPDGHLFIGHSESLHNITNRFKPLGRTIYTKVNPNLV